MGEYVKNRQHPSDVEIKIGVYGEKITSNYPLDILKELKYLGYEDFYAEEFTGSGIDTLSDLIDNFNTKVVHSWITERVFVEIVSKTKKAENILNKLIRNGECDIVKLYRSEKPIYLISELAIDKVLEKTAAVEFIPYKYQYLRD